MTKIVTRKYSKNEYAANVYCWGNNDSRDFEIYLNRVWEFPPEVLRLGFNNPLGYISYSEVSFIRPLKK